MLTVALLSLAVALAQPAGDGDVISSDQPAITEPDTGCTVTLDGTTTCEPSPASVTLGPDGDGDGDGGDSGKEEETILWKPYHPIVDLFYLMMFFANEGERIVATAIGIAVTLGAILSVPLNFILHHVGRHLVGRSLTAQRAVERLQTMLPARPATRAETLLRRDLAAAKRREAEGLEREADSQELVSQLKTTLTQQIRLGLGREQLLQALLGDAVDLSEYTVEAVEGRLREKKSSSSPGSGEVSRV